MSKILVVEPYRILQQAIAIALYPENDVQLTDAIPESLNVENFDAAIVDAASLREKDRLSVQALRTVYGWKLPTVWIDGEVPGQAPVGNRVVILKQPISRDGLVAALAECLGLPSVAKREGRAATDREQEPRSSSKETATENKAAATEQPEFIELTDIVEEGPASDRKER
jgi:hypothetical protein